MAGNKKRLFLGTFLTEDLRTSVEQFRSESEIHLSAIWNCNVRWVKPAKLHMTWLFLGQCDLDAETQITNFLESKLKTCKSTTINFDKFDFFPSQAKRQLMALVPNTVPASVAELAADLREGLLPFCEKKDIESFKPHITLFRFPREDQRKFERPEAVPEALIVPTQLKLDQICLIQSNVGPKNDDYKPLAQYRLNHE